MIRNIETRMQNIFNDFPPHSRVWIYQANKAFPVSAAIDLQPEFDAFAKHWTAHNHQLKAEIHLLHDYFIVIMVDEDFEQPGGCSIDVSVKFIKDIGKKYDIELLDRMRVSYIHEGLMENCSVVEFVNRLRLKEFNAETPMVNTLVQNKKELETQFLIPLRDSWLRKYL